MDENGGRPLCPTCFKPMSRQLDGHGRICLPCGKKFETDEEAREAMLAGSPIGNMFKAFGQDG